MDSDTTLDITKDDVKIVDKQKSAEYDGNETRQVQIECLDSSSPYDAKTSEGSKAQTAQKDEAQHETPVDQIKKISS